jgi:CelD/BcsL family acetyltransferase involved in cellulose biosynthesis
MKTRIYRTIDKEVIKDWQKLWEKSPYANYTNSPQWFLSVLESFEYSDYVIIALYEKENLVVAGALVKEKKYGIDVYTVAPGDFVSGFPFLMKSKDKKLFTAIRKQLIALGNVYFTNVPEDSVLVLHKNKSDMRVTPQAANFVFSLDKDHNGNMYIAKRKKLMRSVKGIEEKFEVKSYDGTSSKALATTFSLDKNSRKQSRGYSPFVSLQIKNFYKILAKHFKENMRINILYFKNMPIAYEIGFIAGKTYFGNQIAFKYKYKQYVPGKVLIVKLLEQHTKEGIEKMDFGSGDNHIKRAFTKNYNQFYQVVVSANKFVRIYIPFLFQVKNELYNRLQEHLTIYFAYRSMRKRIFSEN